MGLKRVGDLAEFDGGARCPGRGCLGLAIDPRLERARDAEQLGCTPSTITRACTRFREMAGLAAGGGVRFIRPGAGSNATSRRRFERSRTARKKLAAAFTSTSNFSLANADVIRPKKTIARSMKMRLSN
jgi:hypothetical protein